MLCQYHYEKLCTLIFYEARDEELKQAILILDHMASEVLKSNLEIVPDDLFDVYIHFDKSMSQSRFDSFTSWLSQKQLANVYIIEDRIKTAWAAPSLMAAELNLFKEANKRGYKYYHLISGADVFTKKPKQVFGFFENASGEWVDIWEINTKKYENRVRYWYPLTEFGVRKHGIIWILQKALLVFQKAIRVNRNIGFKQIVAGSQWGSFSDQFVTFLVQNSQKIKDAFANTLVPDELYKTTVLYENQDFFKIRNENFRYYRFVGNSPENLSPTTLSKIASDKYFFARKVASMDGIDLTEMLRLHDNV